VERRLTERRIDALIRRRNALRLLRPTGCMSLRSCTLRADAGTSLVKAIRRSPPIFVSASALRQRPQNGVLMGVPSLQPPASFDLEHAFPD
jgi:hypothetical protein